MKSILLFPGIDAIETDSIRQKCMQLPEVQIRLQEAQAILDKLAVPISLEKVMSSKRQETLEWFSAMVLATMPVQVGIFDRYKNQGNPIDALLGMSLGDLARSVCAGVASFSATFIGLLKFIEQIPAVIGTGTTYQVKISHPQKDILEQLQCKAYDIDVSVYQSDTSFLLSGRVENLKSWSKHAATLENVTVKELFKIPVPLHSALLKDLALSIANHIDKNAHFKQSKYPIYSSILNKWIQSQEELKMDMLHNIDAPVLFSQSIHHLIAQKEPIRFVNIGPASTMFAFIKQMQIPNTHYQLVPYFSETSKCLV